MPEHPGCPVLLGCALHVIARLPRKATQSDWSKFPLSRPDREDRLNPPAAKGGPSRTGAEVPDRRRGGALVTSERNYTLVAMPSSPARDVLEALLVIGIRTLVPERRSSSANTDQDLRLCCAPQGGAP